MKTLWSCVLTCLCLSAFVGPAAAQNQPEPTTRAGVIEQEQKAKDVHPYQPGTAEKWLNYAESTLTTGSGFHPFFVSAYSGGGFTLGAGYLKYVSPYNTVDVRGSLTFSGYKRIETEFIAPELFGRTTTLSVLGGWRDATKVAFYGIGQDSLKQNRTSFSFEQPYASTLLTVRPTRRLLLLSAGVEASQWRSGPAGGAYPSIETAYTPETLPGLGAQPTYIHTQGTVGIDSRLAPDYARRGGFYGVTFHDYADPDSQFGFERIEYRGAAAHSDSARDVGALAPRARRDDLAQRRSGDSVLHAAVAGQRLDSSWVFQLALPRSQQPSPAG